MQFHKENAEQKNLRAIIYFLALVSAIMVYAFFVAIQGQIPAIGNATGSAVSIYEYGDCILFDGQTTIIATNVAKRYCQQQEIECTNSAALYWKTQESSNSLGEYLGEVC